MDAIEQNASQNSLDNQRSLDPNDGKKETGDQDEADRKKGSDVLNKPRRFSQKDVQKIPPPDRDPDDPVSH